jgi:hypothetical protein
MDCQEQVGFDLCDLCYNTKSKLPGRFNQQHTPDHRFERDDSYLLARILLQRAAAVNYEDEVIEEEHADQDGGNEVNPGQF